MQRLQSIKSHFNINPIIAIAKAEEISEEMDRNAIIICTYIMALTLVSY